MVGTRLAGGGPRHQRARANRPAVDSPPHSAAWGEGCRSKTGRCRLDRVWCGRAVASGGWANDGRATRWRRSEKWPSPPPPAPLPDQCRWKGSWGGVSNVSWASRRDASSGHGGQRLGWRMWCMDADLVGSGVTHTKLVVALGRPRGVAATTPPPSPARTSWLPALPSDVRQNDDNTVIQ